MRRKTITYYVIFIALTLIGFTIKSNNSNTLAITSPNTSNYIIEYHTITWESEGNIDNVKIDFTINDGGNWLNIVESTPNDGSYNWDVPSLISDLCKVRIRDVNNFSTADQSDSTFQILACTIESKFTYNENDLCAGNNITFTNQTMDIENPDLNGVNYRWLVDGIELSSVENFTTNFNSSGFKIITLEANYLNGCKNFYTDTIYIKPATTADFIFDQKPDFSVDLIANQAEASSYNWTMNNVNIGNAKIITHNFDSGGSYNICLSTNSNCGNQNICKNIVLIDPDPCINVNLNSNFEVVSEYCSKEIGFFSNTSTGASAYEWLVNGIYQSSTVDFHYQFPVQGEYNISLVASSGSCSDTKNKTILVNPTIKDLNPSSDIFDCNFQSATLNAGVSNMQNYKWKKDGVIVGLEQSITVSSSGEYFIEVTDKCGNNFIENILVAINDSECVMPGDLNFDGEVNQADIIYWGIHFGESGYSRFDSKVDWTPKASLDWGISLFDNPNVDLKHVDANGNGLIDIADFNALQFNWQKTHGNSNNINKNEVSNLGIDTNRFDLSYLPSYHIDMLQNSVGNSKLVNDFNKSNTNNLKTLSQVWPGDINNDGIINNNDFSFSGKYLCELGPPRDIVNIEWKAYTAQDWGIVDSLTGLDIKYHDTDGNGIINTSDLNAIVANQGKTANNNLSNVWPGDVNFDGIVDEQDRTIQYIYYGNSGPFRNSASINWFGQPAQDWDTLQTNGTDFKHLDCDGNGIINILDKNGIIINWGKTHNEGINTEYFHRPNGIFTNGLISTDHKIYLQPVGNISSNNIVMDIVFENINQTNTSLFGCFFEIHYQNVEASSVNLTFNDTWLGQPNVNLMTDYRNIPSQNRVEVAISRTDGTNISGKGIIGRIAFQLANTNTNELLTFEVNQIGAHDNQGMPIYIEDKPLNINKVNADCLSSLTISDNTPFQNQYKSSGILQTTNSVIIGQNQDVEYKGNRIRLNNGFSVRVGADFKVRSSGCN